LAKGNFLTFLTGETPKGYCVKVVSDQLSLLVNLTGIIDIDVEISRLNKEVERLNPIIDGYQRKIAVADYEAKVPEAVRAVNAEKLAAYQAELDAVIIARNAFIGMI